MCDHTEEELIMAEETTEHYFQYYTQKAGDIARQLGLVGAVITWTFNVALKSEGFNSVLLWVLALIFLSLSIDAIQYIIGSLLWKNEWNKDSSKKAKDCTGTVRTLLFFIGIKLVVMLIAYFVLAVFFVSNFT
jgi:hypothetical protein